MEEKEKDVIEAKIVKHEDHEGEEIPAILKLGDDEVIKAVRRAEARLEVAKKIKEISLSVTRKEHWSDHNGTPYLEAAGCEAIAFLWGIRWSDLKYEKVQFQDGHYMYKYYGKFTLGNITIEAIGSRSSRDDFFRVRYKGDQRIELPPDQVDEGDVWKAAYTNLLQNGIKRILGIRSITWDDLEKVGIKRENVSKVAYKSRKKEEEVKRRGRKKQEEKEDWKAKFLEHVDEFRKKLGDDTVDLVFEKFGYEDEKSVNNFNDAKKIYIALKASSGESESPPEESASSKEEGQEQERDMGLEQQSKLL